MRYLNSNLRMAGIRYPSAYGTGGGLPAGFDWVIYNGQQVTFTGTYNGVSYVNAPVYARIV